MKYISKIILLLAVVFATSCKNDLLDTAPYGSISSGNMWTTENLADRGVIGVYQVLRGNYVINQGWILESFGVSADCRDTDYAILLGTATSGNGTFSTYWKSHYEGINRANDAIANLPNAPLDEAKMARLIAECKFLRAFYYYRLNSVFKGVPLYLEPTELEEFVKGRETEATIWQVVIDDLTDCINESNLPNKYAAGNADYGRITKSAAYALRGKAYLWTQEWEKAVNDFEKVGELGHSLFQGEYKQLFKEANEQSDEMVFTYQCINLSGYGHDFSFRYGSRLAYGSCWNTIMVNTDFVDTYEWQDGSKFNWDEIIPGYTQMDPAARSVYFLRDQMTEDEITRMTNDQGSDMSKYLASGNEARILQAYEGRDPRLLQTVITPYSTYLGTPNATDDYTYVLRWPYRSSDYEEMGDLRTDTNTRYHYLFRKFVAEGANEIEGREYSQVDLPIIRYADVLLNKAEALNELGRTAEAIEAVNQVRRRVNMAELQNSDASKPTYVTGQADLRARIQNERRWEFAGEFVNVFDEIRWKTWQESKFFNGAGYKQIWGQQHYGYTWAGDEMYAWAIPRDEIEMNENLTQNAGWR